MLNWSGIVIILPILDRYLKVLQFLQLSYTFVVTGKYVRTKIGTQNIGMVELSNNPVARNLYPRRLQDYDTHLNCRQTGHNQLKDFHEP